jgi:hypothetical protein
MINKIPFPTNPTSLQMEDYLNKIHLHAMDYAHHLRDSHISHPPIQNIPDYHSNFHGSPLAAIGFYFGLMHILRQNKSFFSPLQQVFKQLNGLVEKIKPVKIHAI